MNDVIGKSFARIGTRENPEGFVIASYRETNRLISVVLDTHESKRSALPVTISLIDGMRSNIRSEMSSEIYQMVSEGQDEAIRQLRYYGEIASPFDEYVLLDEVNAAIAAIDAQMLAQRELVRSLLLSDAETEQIVGSEDRSGILRYSDISALAVSYAASFVWDGFTGLLDFFNQSGGTVYKKQAVAALDERTTDCCLRVHGQIRDFWRPFDLEGVPRYANKMQFPAFHRYCRTAVALYDGIYDNGITQELERSAQVILNERSAGGSGYRHPADAYS